MIIYKILTSEQWQQFQTDGEFAGAPIDLTDGYIHFSTRTQLIETANKHFAGQSALQLLALDDQKLGDGLRYEPSRGGDLFPHLYGRKLQLDDVIDETLWTTDGAFEFPEGFIQ